jgi:hypothetical protein
MVTGFSQNKKKQLSTRLLKVKVLSKLLCITIPPMSTTPIKSPFKLNTSIVPRRSPRLNPPPRRSPRIEEQKQHQDEAKSPSVPDKEPAGTNKANNEGSPRLVVVGRAIVPDVRSRVSPRFRTTPKSKSSTPSSARSPILDNVTPKTPKSESSTSSKSTVTFRRTICAVQNFDEAYPPSDVRRQSVKRFFIESSDESPEDEPKCIKKIGTHTARLMDHPISVLTFTGVVMIAIAAVVVRVWKW